MWADANLFSSAHAECVKPGSRGYFADTVAALRRLVKERGPVKELVRDNGEDAAARFYCDDGSSCFLFYKVSDPPEKVFRPYSSTAEADTILLGRTVCLKNAPSMMFMITAIGALGVYIGPNGWISLENLFNDYMFPDGRLCGVEVEYNYEKD